MATLPTNRTTSNTSAEHVSDHNIIHGLWNVGTTKGDIIVAQGAQDYVRLPVGANGFAVVADSAQASGVKWSSVPSLTRSGWHLTRAAAQSITQSSVTNISWDTEIQDTPNNFTAPGTTLTIPTGGDGLWLITYNVNFAAAVDYNVVTATIVAGTITWQVTDSDDATYVLNPNLLVTVLTPLVATNTIVCTVRHNAAAAQNVTARITAYYLGA